MGATRHTAPNGRDGRFETIRDLTLFAIVNEFAGPNPSELQLDSKVAYQQTLPFPANDLLDPNGRLVATASPAAKCGEQVFLRPFAVAPEKSGAAWLIPRNHFADGQTHDVGTGRAGKIGNAFETPTLLETKTSAP